MKHIKIIAAMALVISIMGCTKKYTPPPVVPSLSKDFAPTIITTPQIIEMLERGDIKSVNTSHSQVIVIRLKNGNLYKSKYIHKQAGKYAEIESCFDILNLVIYIHDKRFWIDKPLKWQICCE